MKVRAKRLGWNEPSDPGPDLDPFDQKDVEIEGELDILVVEPGGFVPSYKNYTVAGQPVDPSTIQYLELEQQAAAVASLGGSA